jgi:hypothetical protein
VREVTSEVSVSRRCRSSSARSALPLKDFLAQLRNPRLLCDEPEPEAAVSAWTEAELPRKGGFVGQGRGGVAAVAGAWPGRPLAGPTLESGCRGHKPGWRPQGTAG